ncbi:MAG: HAD family hydrolase [Clostridiales bacterium]|nr:HAD family hydrolase [Clostridiales bacterium]
MKKAIIFDLDGTLINSLPDISAAMNKVLVSYGLPSHDETKYKLFTGDGAKNLALRALGDNKELFDKVYQSYAEEYAKNSRVNTVPYHGIPQLLYELGEAGIKICVLSNKGHSDVKKVLKYFFPKVQFAYSAGVREGGPVKPDPRAAQEVLQALALSADECWYIGDTITDMRCAADAGIPSIAVGWGFQSKQMISQADPDYFVENVEELRQLLIKDHKKH